MDSDVLVLIAVASMTTVFGIQLIRGKWLMLIAGYNTMGAEKRKAVNGKALGKAVGLFLLYTSVLCILPIWFPVVNHLFGGLILLPTLFLLVYVNVSPRFKNK
ncbi:DUF3784 domain-containing protein [uncultured Enterococcus sp.]|uniref:DUF3784 domain-containing protein n=1 Tax=uncultured Enterococcus sp. TaxID=167972 RepID=UPI002AA7EA16|nr:DUF3784 domain-containing protein [uncultured Enterococcus sp.]